MEFKLVKYCPMKKYNKIRYPAFNAATKRNCYNKRLYDS